MPNFYEVISVNPTSNAADIEAAIENHYNQVRRLTTHYDAKIVNQANQALLILEQIRATLLNPSKRVEYDASLGIGVGGIADPQLVDTNNVLPATSMQVPIMTGAQQPAGQFPISQVRNTWACPKCQYVNPANTTYCQNCREVIGRICPNCQGSYEARANYCPGCGQSYEHAAKRAQLMSQLQQKKVERYSLPAETTSTPITQSRLLEAISTFGSGWALFMGSVSIHFFFVTLIRLIISLFDYATLQKPAMATIIRLIDALNLFVQWAILIVVITFLLFIIRKRHVKLNSLILVGYGVVSLLALGLSGADFSAQVYGDRGSSWLIFPSLVCLILIGAGWYTLHGYVNKSPTVSMSWLQRINKPTSRLNTATHLVNKGANIILDYLEQSPHLVFGVGIGLSFLTLFLSASKSVLSILGIISGMGSCIILALVAYRAYNLVDVERSNLQAKQELVRNKLLLLESEISDLEIQVKNIDSISN